MQSSPQICWSQSWGEMNVSVKGDHKLTNDVDMNFWHWLYGLRFDFDGTSVSVAFETGGNAVESAQYRDQFWVHLSMMDSLVLQLTAGDAGAPLPEFVNLPEKYRCDVIIMLSSLGDEVVREWWRGNPKQCCAKRVGPPNNETWMRKVEKILNNRKVVRCGCQPEGKGKRRVRGCNNGCTGRDWEYLTGGSNLLQEEFSKISKLSSCTNTWGGLSAAFHRNGFGKKTRFANHSVSSVSLIITLIVVIFTVIIIRKTCRPRWYVEICPCLF